MHSDAFDRYHHRHSLIHHLDPRIKVVITIAFIISNALLPDGAWISFALAWLFILVANMFSQLGIGFTFRRSFIALPFALAAITVLFSIPGKPISSFHFLMWNFTITDAGLLRFVSIVIRSWLSVQMAILLVAVTEFPKIIHALTHLRVPAIITTIISFLYRYLFVLTDEVLRLLRARLAHLRPLDPGYDHHAIHRTALMDIMECDGDIVKVDDLHFAYPDEHVALRGVSFNLCVGEKVALVGPNGAGKSTLMLQLNGILEGRGGIEIGGM